MLRDKGIAMLPALGGSPVTAAYAGLRPASERKEYRLNTYPERRYVSVGGIRSNGLSSALGLEREVEALLDGGWTPPALPAWPYVALIAADANLHWAAPGNGGHFFHCETVPYRSQDRQNFMLGKG